MPWRGGIMDCKPCFTAIIPVSMASWMDCGGIWRSRKLCFYNLWLVPYIQQGELTVTLTIASSMQLQAIAEPRFSFTFAPLLICHFRNISFKHSLYVYYCLTQICLTCFTVTLHFDASLCTITLFINMFKLH